MARALDPLLATMRAELDALDSGDAGLIEAATVAKLSALTDIRTAAGVALDQLYEARELNALASTRVNMLMAGIDRRLAALVATEGRPATLCYGRTGRSEPRC